MSTRDVERIELLQDTLDLLILRTLLLRPRHGHAIAKCIEYSTTDVLAVGNGTVYPALHRLIRRKWIVAEEGRSENNRRGRFYRVKTKGRKQLTVETGKCEKLSEAIARILKSAEQKGGRELVHPDDGRS
ncbi:PadR family transcriptional regulator [Acidicapsa dinghuensis]|uniref:PadR family transcriptional regulator n=1 Tax=Acidicapsa dinghuensis TaxID=2218256 RepID=A0ABW1EEM5_9BACT|nr:PadR family transcriptional regulator [Acidicapsa dinghuensis]